MSATDGKDRPKTYSLADAVKEVKYWVGVNMLRFTYDKESMSAPQNVLSLLNAPTLSGRLSALGKLVNQQESPKSNTEFENINKEMLEL